VVQVAIKVSWHASKKLGTAIWVASSSSLRESTCRRIIIVGTLLCRGASDALPELPFRKCRGSSFIDWLVRWSHWPLGLAREGWRLQNADGYLQLQLMASAVHGVMY
jgi:hypothetical protein